MLGSWRRWEGSPRSGGGGAATHFEIFSSKSSFECMLLSHSLRLTAGVYPAWKV
jgi:hypothetical protein